MTNKEKYKQAFSAIHTSYNLSLEVEEMKIMEKKYKFKKMIATVAACVMIVGSASVAYAANLGGIQRTIQLWIAGVQTDATIEFDGNGNYTMDYIDSEGESKHQGGGGIAIEEDGTERALTQEELMEQLKAPEVEYKEDGSVWVYWLDQKIDITDKFKNDICHIELVGDEETLYMTVKYQDGYALSPDKYQEIY